MKLIHCADIHLGSKITSFNDKVNKERKEDVIRSFMSLIEYAHNNNIQHILMSGDLFDSDHPSLNDYQNAKSIFSLHPDITFYYLKGNHDVNNNYFSDLVNVKLFNKEGISYALNDNIAISGMELDYSENSLNSYDNLNIDKNKINIVLLHGDINKNIDLNKLAEKGVNYVALGHIHKTETLEKNGMIYSYPGCLEGRGFDECGPKGFIELDLKDNNIETTFKPFNRRNITIISCDIGAAQSDYDIIKMISALNLNNKDIYRVELVGQTPYTFSKELIEKESQKLDVYYLEIKDRTQKKIDYQAYINDISIIGAFTREALKIDDESLRNEVLALGYEELGVNHE